MSFKLKANESLCEGVCRIAYEQGEFIRESLNKHDGEDEGKAIHSARKSVKKLRALLRLICDNLGRKIFKEENQTYRDIGRELSEARDAIVLGKSLDKLQKQFDEQVPAKLFERARRLVVSDESTSPKDLPQIQWRIEKKLKRAMKRIDSWPLQDLTWNDLYCGLKRTYQQGQQTLAAACKDPSPENLHEWRKRVKDLWYHLRLLQAAWPEVMGNLAKEVQVLSEYLGDDHDLANLQETLKKRGMDKEALIPLTKVIKLRRMQLSKAAFDLGNRLYVEKPKSFAARVEGYWDTWNRNGAGRPSKKRSVSKNRTSTKRLVQVL